MPTFTLAQTGLRFVVQLMLAGALLLPQVVSAQPVAPVAPISQVDIGRRTRVVQQAYDLLMDQHVYRFDPAPLLQSGWDAIVAEAKARGVRSPAAAPALSNDRSAAISAFRAALADYLGASPELPAAFLPEYAAINAMVLYTGETHTSFMSPAEYAAHLQWVEGSSKYAGIGVSTRRPGLTISEVFPGSPAEAAGIQSGDRVLAVNGTAVEGLRPEETADLIRGPEGSAVSLSLARPGVADPIEVTVVRAQIAIAFVTSRMLSDQIGYIRLRSFPPTVAPEFEAAVDKLIAQGATSLVVDLRGNGGGSIAAGLRLLSHFVPAGTVVFRQLERGGQQDVRSTRSNTRYDLPVVVLVDGASASMAEIFASAVQEAGTAIVVGTTTSGNVAAAQVFPLGDGSGIQVTVTELRSGQGKVLNGIGVVPDQIVELDAASIDAGEDLQLDRAVEILQEQTQAASRTAA